MTTKAGFVAVLGQPNSGKSTLINTIVGTKVSIVSPKIQTTRRRVLGITIRDKTQIILVDTPGIFSPKKPLEKAMVKAAWEAPQDADFSVVIVDASYKDIRDTEEILKELAKRKQKIILCLNKIDVVKKEELLGLSAQLNALVPIEKTFMISALLGQGVSELLDFLTENLPSNPWYYPEDQISDLPQRQFAAEITREHIFRQLHQEIPYSLTVETEAWEVFKNGSLKISQVVYVERPNQKAILLGKNGARIKAIGAASRKELSFLFQQPVHLMLHVKVDPKWLTKTTHFEEMGLEIERPIK